jgi:lipoate-protein ligase A
MQQDLFPGAGDELPGFAGDLKKNDALFLNGAMENCKPYVFTYEQVQTEIVHGPSCVVDKEINVDKCKEDNVPVIPRRGGGGLWFCPKGCV